MVVVMIIIMVMVVMHKWSACTADSWHQVRLPKSQCHSAGREAAWGNTWMCATQQCQQHNTYDCDDGGVDDGGGVDDLTRPTSQG